MQCAVCDGDRVVFEIKGPTAYVNYSRSKGIYQTEKYRQAYADDAGLACECLALAGAPYLVLLDARSRDRAAVMAAEVLPERALAGWVWLGYEDVLPLDPFAQHAVAEWLLKAH